MFKKGLLLTAAGVVASLISVGSAQAVPFGPSSIVVAGITYSNFDVVLTGFGNVTPTAAGQIAVTANAAGNGISFSSGFTAAPPISFADANITFNAFSSAGITGANLNIVAGTFGGLAVASVAVTIFNAANNVPLTNLLAFCSSASCTVQDETDPDSGFKSLGGSFTSLRIQKDINVTSFGGFSQLSVVNEGFQSVPEPMSLALLGTGLVGLGVIGRRKSS